MHVQVQHLSLCLIKEDESAERAGGTRGRPASCRQLVRLIRVRSPSLVSLTLSGQFYPVDFFGDGDLELEPPTSTPGLLGVRTTITPLCYTCSLVELCCFVSHY